MDASRMTPGSSHPSNGFFNTTTDDNKEEENIVTNANPKIAPAATNATIAETTTMLKDMGLSIAPLTANTIGSEGTAIPVPRFNYPTVIQFGSMLVSPAPSGPIDYNHYKRPNYGTTTALTNPFSRRAAAAVTNDDQMMIPSERLRIHRVERHDETIALATNFREVLVRIRPQWDEEEKDKMSMMFAEMVQKVDDAPTAVQDLTTIFERLMRG